MRLVDETAGVAVLVCADRLAVVRIRCAGTAVTADRCGVAGLIDRIVVGVATHKYSYSIGGRAAD